MTFNTLSATPDQALLTEQQPPINQDKTYTSVTANLQNFKSKTMEKMRKNLVNLNKSNVISMKASGKIGNATSNVQKATDILL